MRLKKLLKFLKAYNFKHAFSVALAVAIAVMINHYFSFSKEYWTVLAAFIMGQTTLGTPLRQALIYFLVMVISIVIANFLLTIITQSIIVDVILAILFIFSSYITFVNRPLTNENFFLMMLFSITLLIAVLTPTITFMQNKIVDVVMGSFIGILCSQFLFPISLSKEFSRGIVPILQALVEYAKGLTEEFSLINDNRRQVSLNEEKVRLEIVTQQGLYPEWAYELGFNPGLRSGFRFFLINLGRLTELLFSMKYLITCDMKLKIKDLAAAIVNSMRNNNELLAVLVEYFANNQFKVMEADFTSDMIELENTLRKIIPGSLELLDISPDYVTLTALVRDIKDMRKILLELVAALPAKPQ